MNVNLMAGISFGILGIGYSIYLIRDFFSKEKCLKNELFLRHFQ